VGSSKSIGEIKKRAANPAQEIEKIREMSTREIYREIGLMESRGGNLSYDETIRLGHMKGIVNERFAAGKAGKKKDDKQ
jgi:hypothetical protein